MKKMSIVLILLSCALTIFSHLINQFDSLFFSLPMFYPSVDLFIRFGDLLIIFGFIGLFLSTKKHPKIKVYSFLFAFLGIIRFLVIDLGVTGNYHLIPNIILFLQIVGLTLWVLEVKTIQVPLLTIKGYAVIAISFIYYIAVQIISLLPNYQESANPNPAYIVITFFLIAYQIGLWIFFKEWYKEAYIYKNPDLSRI